MARIVDVIVDIAHTNVDRVFAYRLPDPLSFVVPGYRVVVPFGQGNKPVEGFVVSETDEANLPSEFAFSGTLKEVLRAREDFQALDAQQLELAQWMRVEYGCLLIDALRLMIPAQMRGARVREKSARTVRLALGAEELIDARERLTLKSGLSKAPMQSKLLELLESGVEMPISDVERLISGASGALRAMEKKGWVEFGRHGVRRRPYESLLTAKKKSVEPTPEQERAIAAITEAMRSGGGAFLLHGVTGSGKTEVYMRCIAAATKADAGAIVLVPEIALTPQTVSNFRERFGDSVAVLHSRLTPGERYDEWLRIRRGEVPVVVGARSAVFAPLKRIGLIVIDEEHEGAYKSETMPRYSALDVAGKRCERHGGVLVLGSATPSLETYYRMTQGGYELLEMPERIKGNPLPKIEIVDMREELLRGNRTIFSQMLYREIKLALSEGRQLILFINRRGYSTFVLCRGCGFSLKCDECDVSLTYHKSDETAKCHYCGREYRVPTICPSCNKPYLKHFGAGTQQVEEQLKRYFPGITTLRMDFDTTRTKDAHLSILQAFASHKAQALIGTQMIAKGLDFPEVTLVGVIAADSSLRIPDYRSFERTFQLVTQVAGRAGRDKFPGKVIVQTYSPEHPSIVHASTHDYKSFYAEEIARRELCELPPFATFARLLLEGDSEAELMALAEKCKEELTSKLHAQGAEAQEDVLYVMAAPAPVKLIKNKYRFTVLIKLKNSERLSTHIRVIQSYAAQNPALRVEINPQSML